MDRRQFMTSAAVACATAAAAKPHSRKKPQRWGLQLFTVGALLEADFEGTLRKIAALGYREVETIGSFGRDPKWLREQLGRLGLSSPSQHLASDELYATFGKWTRREITTDQVNATYTAALAHENIPSLVRDGITKAKRLGQTYIAIPILMPPMMASREILDRYIAAYNEAGRICREEGKTFVFHNHDAEFGRMGNDVIYDLILKGTDPALVKMELDLYWISKAGADPLHYFSAHPGRFVACHVKDMDKAGGFAAAGSGTLDLPGMIGGARRAGVKHFFVEIDRSDDPMKATTDSIAFLKG